MKSIAIDTFVDSTVIEYIVLKNHLISEMKSNTQVSRDHYKHVKLH